MRDRDFALDNPLLKEVVPSNACCGAGGRSFRIKFVMLGLGLAGLLSLASWTHSRILERAADQEPTITMASKSLLAGLATAGKVLGKRSKPEGAVAAAAGGPNLQYVSPPASDAAGQYAAPVSYPTQLYPDIEPFDSGLLDVGDGHQLYYDVSGKPDGIPCLFLHGGPGAGCSPRCRRFFDPSFYKIVILDQRGSGKSKPNAADDLKGSLVENTTPKLVGDIERLRKHLGIDTWGLILGGSWGSTLALAYAQAHPKSCHCVLLRGVFLFTPEEVDYLFASGGTAGQNPQAWDRYCDYIRESSTDWDRESKNLLGAYWERLMSKNATTREAAAAAFVGYELSISKTYIDPNVIEEYLGTPSILIPFAVMEVHYMLNAGFLRRGQLLDNARLMSEHGHHVAIAHGRADYVCKPQAAWHLTKALRASGGRVELEFVAGAGHSDSEPGLVDAMVRATDRFKEALLERTS